MKEKIEGILDINGAVWTPPAPKNKRKAIEELSTLIQQERADTIDETIAVIEGYFKGLIAIPDPQKTKESLIGYIYSLKDISVNLSQLNKGEIDGNR